MAEKKAPRRGGFLRAEARGRPILEESVGKPQGQRPGVSVGEGVGGIGPFGGVAGQEVTPSPFEFEGESLAEIIFSAQTYHEGGIIALEGLFVDREDFRSPLHVGHFPLDPAIGSGQVGG